MIKFKNTKKQGDAGMGCAIAHFCKLGVPISIPLTDSQDYDLVVEMENSLKKIQVKMTNEKNPAGSYKVGLRVLGGNSRSNFVHKLGNEVVYDYLFVVTGDMTEYLIPKSVFSQYTTALTLCKKWDIYRL